MDAFLAILNDPLCMFVDSHLQDFKVGSPEYELLQIFAYGTWNDYLQLEKTLPANLKLPTDGPAAKKLKKLTILTIAKNQPLVAYQTALSQTGLSKISDLETLVIELISNGLLVAKIDEQNEAFIIERVAARCIKNDKQSLDEIIEQISQIRQNIDTAMKEN